MAASSFLKAFTCPQSWEGQAATFRVGCLGMVSREVGQNRSPAYLMVIPMAQLYMVIPPMDVTCHLLSTEPPKRNFKVLVAPKSISSVKHISCLHV